MLFARKISSNNLFSYVNFVGDSKTIPDYKSGFVNEKRFAFIGFGVTWRTTFCIGEVRGIHCWSCLANEIKLRTKNWRLTKRSIGEVQPQTKADSEPQLKLDCLAPFFANALLYGRFYYWTQRCLFDLKILMESLK